MQCNAIEPVTNGLIIEWYKVNLNFGKISEAKIKTEAVKFFDLSEIISPSVNSFNFAYATNSLTKLLIPISFPTSKQSWDSNVEIIDTVNMLKL